MSNKAVPVFQPFPIGSERDGNNTKKVAADPRPLEIERRHREYHKEEGGYPGCERAERPEYSRDDD